MGIPGGVRIKALKKQRQYEFDRVKATLTELGSFDLENPVSEALLFQTGYLTIKAFYPKSGMCELGYPNKEVEQSLKDALLSTYRETFPKYSSPITNDIAEALINKDIPKLIQGLNTLISTIPLDQIVEKKYLQPFQSDARKKYAIGINFSGEKRAVDDYLVKEIR